jgi:hypothetical protein
LRKRSGRGTTTKPPRVSFLSSTLVHLIILLVLGLWITEGAEQGEVLLRQLLAYDEPEEELELETVLLDEELQPATEIAFDVASAPVLGSMAGAPAEFGIPDPDEVMDRFDFERPAPGLDGWRDRLSGMEELLKPVPQGADGAARAVVDDYQQALDRVTQEILNLLAEGKVLVVWCFDQSESMKDDQQEIRARLDRVYAELGMAEATSEGALMTAVTSFGQGFLVHTERPTSDLESIREAIDSVPVDPSGEEMMCSAVLRAIAAHREYAARQDRQMALILVSDESGNREEIDAYLEATISGALEARSKVYVLGREAVFGHPYAQIRWVHPETGRVHWLPVDRGPETAFVEQLQTEGFEPRSDSHPSGFGPYAQSRLAWRTGGIFFMLPSLESNLVRGEKRRYELEAMRPYRPDLRSQMEILMDRQRSPLRSLIWKIVDDLNPYRPEVAKMIQIRQSFSADPQQFARQVQEARAKTDWYYAGLERGIQALDAHQSARDREPSQRWKANYDLIRAQVVAYAARVYAYRAGLVEGVTKANRTPVFLAPNKRLAGWQVRERRGLPIDQKATGMLGRSKELYLTVIENHPGTPWAARAEWELKRDFNYPGGSGAETGIVVTDAKARSSGDLSGDPRAATGLPGETGAARQTAAGATSGTSGWGLDQYPGFELVPQYRAAETARPSDGAPKRSGPRASQIPVPRL